MKLRVLGYHGGQTREHRNVSLLLDGQLLVDAGSAASTLTFDEQAGIRAVLVSHSHLDHVADLGALAEVRAQCGGFALDVAGRPETLDALKAHYFNDVIWPDFTTIPLPDGPAVRLVPLQRNVPSIICGVTVKRIDVPHPVPACGFLIGNGSGTFAYSGDTAPCADFWDAAEQTPDLRLVIAETSFPNGHARLASLSGHLTPALLTSHVQRFRTAARAPIRLFGLKPAFEAEIRRELKPLESYDVRVLGDGEEWNL